MALFAQLLEVVERLQLVACESTMEISHCDFAIQLHQLESHREILRAGCNLALPKKIDIRHVK
jgi:hypothetical protein